MHSRADVPDLSRLLRNHAGGADDPTPQAGSAEVDFDNQVESPSMPIPKERSWADDCNSMARFYAFSVD